VETRQWYKVDLHLHTPASADYQQSEITYLDILREAEAKSLDIIAFTDHNTVKGYAQMLAEIERLVFLESTGRADSAELRRLAEYRRLREKILVLPGFEFTATFGFHILGIFPPQTPVRLLEHILLSLQVPMEALEEGTSNVGASSDVLTAYRVIREAGGLVIAAHVNSAHGVAMKGLDFGGQTRIAYTQDAFLHALEVTDLEKRSSTTTARFFDGTKPGYPRRMRCIQGSDAHRLVAVGARRNQDLGVGDRCTEIFLPAPTFEAMKEVFEGSDFSLTRPYRAGTSAPYDFVQAAREEGETIVQSFHPVLSRKEAPLERVIADACAFANTNGGTIYIGVSANAHEKPVGVPKPTALADSLYAELDARISPKLNVEIDQQRTQKVTVLRLQVPRGQDIPYAIDGNKFYIRDEAETTLAVRDEIVRLVLGARAVLPPEVERRPSALVTLPPEETAPIALAHVEDTAQMPANNPDEPAPPRTGVEIIGTEKRRGIQYHMMRDLRNNNIIHNVTRTSARRLWHYAILQLEEKGFNEAEVQWQGEIGLLKRYRKAGTIRYDLAQRVTLANGKRALRVYYGVTEDGMQGPWTAFLSDDDAPEEPENQPYAIR
jgi:hypothetical protein